jgi:formate dehydrogenase iron-sulfur subunit
MVDYRKEKAFMVYPAKCTACRSCQIACKNWNQNKAIKTINSGSFENPPALNYFNYTKIKFNEYGNGEDYGIKWLFLKEQCLHCTEATCMIVCPSEGALYRTPEGAVAFNSKRCIGCKYCVMTCPFEVPKLNEAIRTISKCHLCYDRIAHGLIPACAKACPTGAITYGDRDMIITEAKEKGANRIYGENELGGLHVMYVLEDSPDKYGLPVDPKVPTSVVLWKNFIKPLVKWGIPFTILGVLLHFWLHGPHVVEEGGEK